MNEQSRTFSRLNNPDEIVSHHYRKLMPCVISSLRKRLLRLGMHCDKEQLAGFYAEAWVKVYGCLRAGKHVENLSAYLVLSASGCAIDERRATGRRRERCAADIGAFGHEPDIDAKIDACRRLQHMLEAMDELLTPFERRAYALCKIRGMSRPDGARELGIPARRMERIMDGACAKMRPAIEMIENDEWCAHYDSTLRALKHGLLSNRGDRYRRITCHLRDCLLCRGRLAEM